MITLNETEPAADARSTANESGSKHSGFSLIELLATLVILGIVSAIVTSGLMQMTKTQTTVDNRTELHSSVRSATELLQQEIGQAGRVTLPYSNANAALNNPTPTLTQAITGIAPGTPTLETVTVSSTVGMFNGEQVVVDAGSTAGSPPTPNQETVTITLPTPNSITATFTTNHNQGAPIAVLGAFASGIVPPNGVKSVNGTAVNPLPDGFHLKMFGDINSDGNIVIIQYDCSPNAAGTGTLTRSVTGWNDAAPGAALTLLNNLANNPNKAPCFQYEPPSPCTTFPCQIQINGVGVDFVTDVAVTLTTQTPFQDPVTHQFQTETKALLNVSPRNIFDIWERASQGTYGRVQPMPDNVANLLNQIQ